METETQADEFEDLFDEADALEGEASEEALDEAEQFLEDAENGIEKLRHEHSLKVEEARSLVTAGEKRLEELRALNGDLRPTESRELRNLEQDLPNLRQRHADLEAAAEWVGYTDEGLHDAWVDRAEVQQEAFAAERAAKAELEATVLNSFSAEARAIAQRKLDRARDATLEAIASTQAARREMANREDDAAQAAAESLLQEQREAQHPNLTAPEPATVDMSEPQEPAGAEPMVPREVPLSESEGG